MSEREEWPPDTEPRQCRRWNKKTQAWQWKARFETREEAAEGPGKGQTLYVCTECGFWHRANHGGDVVIEIFPGEMVTGLWCHQCALPSVVSATSHVGSPDSETTWRVVRCEENAEHVLIEETQ